MARGRGRGRMRFRARPPPSVRSSMQELGLAANANCVVSVNDALGAQVDAARAYFPALELPTSPALQPTEKERELITRFEGIRSVLRASPVAICAPTPRKSALSEELSRARAFFRATRNDAEVSPLGDLWDVDRPWLVPEMLPPELRKVRSGPPQRLNGTTPVQSVSDWVAQAAQGAADGTVEEKEKIEKEKDGDPDAAAQGESEDDDLELDADYETGARFDDDDGYEEADSGKEEALF